MRKQKWTRKLQEIEDKQQNTLKNKQLYNGDCEEGEEAWTG
jgi:hypothetical protein